MKFRSLIQTLLLATAILVSNSAVFHPASAAEPGDEIPGYLNADFHENTLIAEWLFDYERSAWLSSDLVLAQPENIRSSLGNEWFCLPINNQWNCYYGKYDPEQDKYETVIHFRESDRSGFQVVKDGQPAGDLVPYARAIRQALNEIPDSIKDLGIRLNHYVRSIENGKIEVWILPAWQTDGTAIYGADLCYTFDPTGTKLISKKENISKLRGIVPDESMVFSIDNRENELPTVGNVFFLLMHSSGFERINIFSRAFMTTLVTTEEHGSIWIHADREPPKSEE